VLYRDGLPIATLVGGEFSALEPMDEPAQWAARSKLLRAPAEHVPAPAHDPANQPTQRDRLEALFPQT
jgi:hypothetical protein